MNLRIAAAGLLCALLARTAGAAQEYRKLREISIGGEGGWDILTIDSAAHRLYLAHSTKVEVIDLEKNAVVGEIADTPGVHEFVAVPELGRERGGHQRLLRWAFGAAPPVPGRQHRQLHDYAQHASTRPASSHERRFPPITPADP